MNAATPKLPIIFLAGGLGTRLREVTQNQVPKPMVVAEGMQGKPFLYWLVKWFYLQGFREFIFSTGHLSAVIELAPWQQWFEGAHFECIAEASPLGTGGATARIFSLRPKLDKAWIINGDTLTPLSLDQTDFSTGEALYHVMPGELVFDATANLVLEEGYVLGTTDQLEVSSFPSEGQTLGFDAGVVGVSRSALNLNESLKKSSLHEVLAITMKARRAKVRLINVPCYDIGTPQRLERFVSFLAASTVMQKATGSATIRKKK